MAGCGADTLANELSTSLIGDEDFDITLPDFSGPLFETPQPVDLPDVQPITLPELTTVALDGTGVFDVLMRSFKAHLTKEFDSNRISGSEYTKAYVALTTGAMSNAVQFLMTKDAAYLQAIQAQYQAQTAQVQLVTARVLMESEKAKLAMLHFQALSAKSEYALNKIRLSRESIEYCISKFNLDEMLPQQKLLLVQQIANTLAEKLGIDARTALTQVQKDLAMADLELAPLREDMLTKQIAHQVAETLGQTKQNLLLDDEHTLAAQKLAMITAQVLGQGKQNTLLDKQAAALQLEIDQGPKKLELLTAQVTLQVVQAEIAEKQLEIAIAELAMMPAKQRLIDEQAESQRAQTADDRSDGAAVAGTMGEQKKLYTQQITSYQRDAEIKAAKMWVDAWTVMKTMDEGLAAPDQFTNSSVDSVLGSVKSALGL